MKTRFKQIIKRSEIKTTTKRLVLSAKEIKIGSSEVKRGYWNILGTI